ncbi:MAG: NAD-dependent epimerase/dehydratase family protein [Acidobacteriota bacterium]
MKIFVTGATGFTGSHLTRKLIEDGHQVVGLDNQEGRFFKELQEKGADLHVGSVADKDLVHRLTEGCQRVYHLAAAFRRINLPRQVYWDVNVEGTRYVLQAAVDHGVERVLYCSTCGVHGNVENPPAAEDAPIAPADWYQETKWEGERVCHEFLEKGSWITIVRPAAIYGPGDPERFVMLYKRASKGSFPMIGKGDTHYHPLYISNLVDAMMGAIETDACLGKPYLIADESSIAIKELVTEIGKSLGKDVKFQHWPYKLVYSVAWLTELVFKPTPWDPPLFPRRVDWFIQNRSFDISAAKNDFGYAPRVGLAEGLKATGDWYKEEGLI